MAYVDPKLYDTVDYLIICQLRQNARMPAGQIAKVVGANERTVRRRIDRLIDSGSLRLSAICEPAAFGYNNIVDFNLCVTDDKYYKPVIQELLLNENVCYLSKGWENNKLTIQCKFKSSNEISTFINRYLEKIEGVEIENYYFESQVLKDADAWAPKPTDFVESTRVGRISKNNE